VNLNSEALEVLSALLFLISQRTQCGQMLAIIPKVPSEQTPSLRQRTSGTEYCYQIYSTKGRIGYCNETIFQVPHSSAGLTHTHAHLKIQNLKLKWNWKLLPLLALYSA
jgi:hypothetical protein